MIRAWYERLVCLWTGQHDWIPDPLRPVPGYEGSWSCRWCHRVKQGL